jgi:hypothetical protein
MPGSPSRSASIALGLGLLAPLAHDARAAESQDARLRGEDSKLTATMQCDRVIEPGRVRCSLEARVAGNRSIAWADVALIELPPFTSALKGRIGPADATTREPALQRWAFGLVAKKAGEGEARARVRAVVCEPAPGDAAAPRCAPISLDVRATVHVG